MTCYSINTSVLRRSLSLVNDTIKESDLCYANYHGNPWGVVVRYEKYKDLTASIPDVSTLECTGEYFHHNISSIRRSLIDGELQAVVLCLFGKDNKELILLSMDDSKPIVIPDSPEIVKIDEGFSPK